MWACAQSPLMLAIALLASSVQALTWQARSFPGMHCQATSNPCPRTSDFTGECVSIGPYRYCARRLESQDMAPGHHCMDLGELNLIKALGSNSNKPVNAFRPAFWEVPRDWDPADTSAPPYKGVSSRVLVQSP
ncbi:hypothetical protein P389DRAFT_175518 [Cystobasidium minutum MCA 4210]|uniref:uncharacterized protein n=1 Tax=Cystobasidium minutum MCA 4210 TaxID=1397322 RepID=UPI0034CE9399|eukprot:jgi/Rhomi1/175518/fgenesh1_kg.11_\